MKRAILIIDGIYHILPSAPPPRPRPVVVLTSRIAPDVPLCERCGWALERGRCAHAECAGEDNNHADAA